jgi:hypothetical protein
MNLEVRRSLVLARPCCEFRKYDGYSVLTFPIPAESRNEIRIIDPPTNPTAVLREALKFAEWVSDT